MATISKIRKMKENNDKFSSLVLYDFSFGQAAEKAGIDIIVVGDSASMSLMGEKTTVNTTMDMMVYHTKCVSKSLTKTLLIADLPYMSYSNKEEALSNSTKLMQAGADMVKLEGEIETGQ